MPPVQKGPHLDLRPVNQYQLKFMSHPISEEKPNASHMCARIKLHTYDRHKSVISLTIFKMYPRV
jgi:hypothetical protein